jgi:putative membrane protein
VSKTDKGRALRLAGGLATLAGLALMVALVAWQGVADLARLLLSAGWGIAAVTAFHVLPMAASASAWRAATAPAWRGRLVVFLWARLVRDAVNGLMPVPQIGGDAVGARILTFHGARARIAGASVLVDMTFEFLTQIVFTVIGLIVLLALGGGGAAVGWVVLGLAVVVPAAAGFLLAQRWGLFRLIEHVLEWLATRFDMPALRGLARLHVTVLALYRRRPAMLVAASWHLAAWLLGAAEVWLTLIFLGAETSFAEALVIESLGQAIRSAAFLVPGAFGIQEGGYLILGVMFGISPEAALSVSLIKRIRELVLGVPALLAWQVIEGRRLLGPPAAGDSGCG